MDHQIQDSIVAKARRALENVDQNTRTFRLLDALLVCAPTEAGRDVIASDIDAASSEPNGFDRLAEFYKTGLLLPSALPLVLPGPPLLFHHIYPR